jgi:hypothetical protein
MPPHSRKEDFMSKLPKLAAAALLIAATATAGPALAAPLHVIVRGATPLAEPTPGFVFDNDSGTEYGFHGDPLNRYYDPTGIIPDTRYYGPPAVDMVLARTLDVRNESILTHMLKCQAHYPSYSVIGNFYIRAGGLPAVCYL